MMPYIVSTYALLPFLCSSVVYEFFCNAVSSRLLVEVLTNLQASEMKWCFSDTTSKIIHKGSLVSNKSHLQSFSFKMKPSSSVLFWVRADFKYLSDKRKCLR